MLAVISFLSFSLVGVGVVPPSWIAFHIGGSKLVGLVLLASSLTGLLLAPFIGHIVDRHERRQVAMAGQTIRTCGLMLIAPVQFADQQTKRAMILRGVTTAAVNCRV
jgi:MFS family permease